MLQHITEAIIIVSSFMTKVESPCFVIHDIHEEHLMAT